MEFDAAIQKALGLLAIRGKATNRQLLAALDGNEVLLEEVRQALILDDVAKDKDGVGLVLIAPEGLKAPPVLEHPAETPAPLDDTNSRPNIKSLPADSKPSRARLFLSYGRLDGKKLADRLCVDLTKAGFEVWQDTREIHAGSPWEHQIEDGLRSTQLLVALLSPHAVRKSVSASADSSDSVCLDEISFARFARPPKPIVPVMAVACEPPFSIFRLDFVDMQACLESDSQYRKGLERLIESIEAALGGQVRYRSWENQLWPWDFAAFLNEKRKYFCGREWLFDEIDAWRVGSQEPALLITGDPGTGKSAIVAQLIHTNPGGQVLAYHCCQADTEQTLEPWRFVRSIAAMIASQMPEYAALLEVPAIQEALSEARCKADPASSLEEAVLAPLETLASDDRGPRYLLIDALDEALGHHGPLNLVVLLATRLNRFPRWLRVVATTRKEPAVLNRLRGLRARELDAHDPRNLADVRAYIAGRLSQPNFAERLAASRTTPATAAAQLEAKSQGNFLYVRQALDGIERDQYRLDALDVLPPGLYGLYQGFFERHFPTPVSYAAARTLLQVIVAAQQPLRETELAAATGLDLDNELATLLHLLAVYLPARTATDGTTRFTVFHKSLSDWLSDPTLRGSTYYAAPRQGHARLADCAWKEYERGAASMSRYALMYLPTHLIGAEKFDEVERLLTDLQYLEVKAEAGLVFDLANDLRRAVEAIGPRRDGAKLLRLLDEALRRDIQFLATRPAALFQCLWNQAWWYDAPGAAEHYPPADLPTDETLPWDLPGPKLYQLLERWRDEKLARTPNFRWVRSLRPPPTSLGGALRAMLRAHNDNVATIDLSPDGQRLTSAGFDRSICVWDVAGGALLARSTPFDSAVSDVEFTPDGRWLAASTHKAVVLVDSLTLEEVWRIENPQHGGMACHVAVAPSGTMLVASFKQTLYRYDYVSRQLVGKISQGKDRSDNVWQGAVERLVFSPNGRHLAVCRDFESVAVFDVVAGEQVFEIESSRSKFAKAACFSPDGTRLAIGHGGSGGRASEVGIYDAKSGNVLLEWVAHDQGISALAFTSDGGRLASGSYDESIAIWEASTGRCLSRFQSPEFAIGCLTYLADGQHIATGAYEMDTIIESADSFPLIVWNVEGRGQTLRPTCHPSRVDYIALSYDGRQAVSVCRSGAGLRWDIASGLSSSCDSVRRLCAVCLSPSGRYAVSLGEAEGNVFDLEQGARVGSVQYGGGYGIKDEAIISDDMSLIALRLSDWGTDGRLVPESFIRIYSQTSGREVARIPRSAPLVRIESAENGALLWPAAEAVRAKRCGAVMEFLGPDDIEFAAFPASLLGVACDGTETRWAGAVGRHVYLLQLENVTPGPTPAPQFVPLSNVSIQPGQQDLTGSGTE